MNAREAKKIRQLYRRNMSGLSQQFLTQVIKPKPRFVPAFIWYRLMRIFVRIDWEKVK